LQRAALALSAGVIGAGFLFPHRKSQRSREYNDMKRRDFNRIALGISLCPMLENFVRAQATGQTETFAQAPTKNGVTEMSTNDPMAAVRQYIDAFNKGDVKTMAATFAVPGSILDGMAPHVWQGPTATQDWYRDVLVEGKQHGASDYFVTLGEPLHNNVTGDSAYVVVPATMTFKVQGKQVTQSGAVFTVALRKLAESWRIAAWAWAKGTPR
jgi:ketosteroid isomerase-like protein